MIIWFMFNDASDIFNNLLTIWMEFKLKHMPNVVAIGWKYSQQLNGWLFQKHSDSNSEQFDRTWKVYEMISGTHNSNAHSILLRFLHIPENQSTGTSCNSCNQCTANNTTRTIRNCINCEKSRAIKSPQHHNYIRRRAWISGFLNGTDRRAK